MNASATVTLVKPHDGDKKHSVRFNAETKDPLNLLDSVYVSRSFAAINNAKKIRVTVEVLE